MTITHPGVTSKTRSLLGVKDLADQLGISVPTVYRKRSLGEDLPPAVRVGSQIRWRQEAVDKWIEAREEPAA